MAKASTYKGSKYIPANARGKSSSPSSSIPSGGIYNPATGTYFVGGQGYSVASDPNLPNNQLTEAIRKSGGGSSSPSGGGVSTPSQPTPTTQPTQTTIPTPTKQEPTPTPTETRRTETVNILKAGGVKAGGTTYYGSSVVPGTGKTATQLQLETRKEAEAQTGRSFGFGRVSGEITYEIEPTTTRKIDSESEFASKVASGEYKYTMIEPPKAFGLGAKFGYVDVSGNLVGEEMKVFQTGERKQITSKLDLFKEIVFQKELSLLTKESRGKGTILSRASLTGIGYTQGIVSFGETITSPVQTTKEIYSAAKQPIQTFQLLKSNLQTEAATNPYGLLGGAAAQATIFYGPKGLTKLSDLYRTRGLTKIEASDVIAPEYFAGQRYPKIARGETAGQLLKEFTPPTQYGVTRLTGFTAAPKPFAKTTIAQVGSSELAGVYQAPKISPTFLRVSGEGKVFSLNIFDTLKPTATRIVPESFELVGGISKTQRSLFALPKAKQFFLSKAESGKSYIPFVKTEKEAVIPAGTLLSQTRKEFYFEFEGRRIPIYEFETIKGTKINLPKQKVLTVKQVSYKYSGKIGSRGKITPYEVVSLSRVKTSSRAIPKSYSSPTFSSSFSQSVSISSTPLSSVSNLVSSRATNPSISSLSSSTAPTKYRFKLEKSYSQTPPTTKMPPTIPKKFGFNMPRVKPKLTKGFGKFPVFLRRFGKFKVIGYGRTEKEAFDIGKGAATRTLGATFKVEGVTSQPKDIYGFTTKKTKEGTLFIEQPKYRLSKKQEKEEIQMFKKMKGGKIR